MERQYAGESRGHRIYRIIEIGNVGDTPSRAYDIVNTLSIVINLVISLALTFDQIEAAAGGPLRFMESLTYIFFAVDFFLRIYTAKYAYPGCSDLKAAGKYVLSFSGIVDLLSFVPYYLPVFFPAGVVAFRMFRVVRIFRLFRINVYYDSLNVITEVIVSKKQQLLSSAFIILILMTASSLCMYSVEHEAQPEVFRNAFSGMWWSVSTLLTVGYGDIYPVTALGQFLGIVISFLGVGLVAIPTGIISAGFVEQYTRVKRLGEYGAESDVQFIKAHLGRNDEWVGKKVRDLMLPEGVLLAVIQRRNGVIVPRGDVILEENDTVVLGAETFNDNTYIDLKEVVLKEQNPWANEYIRDLDISRKSIIVLVRRSGTLIIPKGDLKLLPGDAVIMYSQKRIQDAERIRV